VPITDVTSDPATLTLTIVGEYPVPVERLWQAWSDPRQIERFWGPPTWPATFTRHDMVEGGRSEYFMTGPDGRRSAGYWIFESVEPRDGFTIVDGFANEDGSVNEDMPGTRTEVRFESTGTGSRYVAVSTFADLASMEQLVEMGMVEGATLAFGQMDQVLADLASFAVGRATEPKLLDDTRVRISRVIRGDVQQVWRAHHEDALMKQWLLGPDGWTMPVCEIAKNVGESYRYEWESDDGANRFGFEGELLESMPPHRAVTTERMIGMDGPSTVNEMTLTEVAGGTLLAIVIIYPSREMRDEILATGMTDGMETSYVRLESLLAAAPV
jgi:uncharacterized protein YndB with AHSA1/START domain